MARIDQTTNSLAVDTDVLFVNITNNRVGINQNSPNTPLHVVGAATIDGNITSTLGTIQGVTLVIQSGGGGSLTFADGTSMSTANNNLGTVTSITAGTGLDGGTITGSGTIDLANTSVTAASYTRASITVDAQGRITAASSGSAPDLAGTIAAGQVAYGASADTIAGNNNLFWDNTNARLGIGTNSPSSSLHIIGVDDDNPEVRVQRSGVTNQYVSIMNEDAGGGFVNSESHESNKKPLYLQSIHDGGGSANGSNSIILRTGAGSSPVERVIITDNTSPSASTSDPQFIIQSGIYLLVDDSIRVGFTSGASPTDYTISARQTTANISGGLFCSSIGESAISNANAGWWLTAGGMSGTAKYTPALKFGSEDTAFTTNTPKYLAGIVGRATETYGADTRGGMAIDFLTFPNNGGANGGPTTRMTIDQDGSVIFAGSFAQYAGAAPADGQLLIGDAAGGVWDAATLTAGSNITITNAAGAITIAASGGGGGGSPGGANGEVQFNDGGAFGANANLTFDPAADQFTIGGSGGRTTFIHAGSMTINSNGGDGRIQGNSLAISSTNIQIADATNLNIGFYGSPGIPQYTVGDPSLLPPDPGALQAWLVELYNAIGPPGMNIIA